MNRFEGSVKGHENIELFTQSWRSEEQKGTIIVTHGMAEHSRYYNDYAKFCVEKGWDVLL
ncbi:MAG: hypothetical protein R2827_16490 [Bdellovibrionales bacterium]